jgi:hypothetical protein
MGPGVPPSAVLGPEKAVGRRPDWQYKCRVPDRAKFRRSLPQSTGGVQLIRVRENTKGAKAEPKV